MNFEKSLFLITARGGSKGIVDKNIKLMYGKPLIHYSIEFARFFTDDSYICLSTDSSKIIEIASQIGYKAPFLRPSILAEDNVGSFDVIKHAINFYSKKNIYFDNVVLLQPTSPIRSKSHLIEASKLFHKNIDMVVSVSKFLFYNIYNDKCGYLEAISNNYTQRQSAPTYYRHNGSIYIINTNSINNFNSFSQFNKTVKYIMPDEFSIDIDNEEDWNFTEKLIKFNNFE